MNTALEQLAQAIQLAAPEQAPLRLAFAYACVSRISQNLEEDTAIAAFQSFGAYLEGKLDQAAFDALAVEIMQIANQHRGSRSLDGSQHAAVSATYALANAINGRALEAAAYAAYSKVYGYGGYAVSDPEAFREEFEAQVRLLQTLSGRSCQDS